MITPHGGELVNRFLTGEARAAAWERARTLPRLQIDNWAVSDLTLIAYGAFSPLTGFMKAADYRRVVAEMRLANGTVWSLPIVLGVSAETAAGLPEGGEIALVQGEEILGLMQVEEKYPYDKKEEARQVFRTEEEAHPGVARLYARGEVLLGGKIQLLQAPAPPAFAELYLTPAGTRAAFAARGWERIVAFQTRNPIHRAHEYLLKSALEIVDGLFLNPLVGETKHDDIPARVRIECYRAILGKYFPPERTFLAAFPAAMRYAGPREAIFHALVRKNYGATHFIVGRDHAGVGNYYGPYDAQKIFREFSPEELGITPLFFENSFYCTVCGNMASNKTCPHPAEDHLQLSGTRIRELLRSGTALPPEFSRPEVAAILAAYYRNEYEGGEGI